MTTKYRYKHYDIYIDYTRDELLPPASLKTLQDRYLLEQEVSPQEAFARAAEAFADDAEHAQRMYDYASKSWFMFSTPILSNAGTRKGLPISCFLQYVPDSIDGLVSNFSESVRLTVNGGGLGAYWGAIRSDGEATSNGSSTGGSVPFIKVIDSTVMAYHQGSTRRGSVAIYQDVSHPEVEEFLTIRKPTGGDPNRKALNVHQGLNVTDKFMQACVEGADWDLIDPHSKRITKTVSARELWKRILEIRKETGEPYLHFIDTSNKHLPQFQKDLGLDVKQSNLCSEITLPTNEERTAVCCLSSLNLEYYDDWKDTSIVADCVRYLDNALGAFIERASGIAGFERAVYSAGRERSLGLGAMGFHYFLQRRGLPFESALAKTWNNKIFKDIKEKADEETVKLAMERGEAPDAEGHGVRNCHLLAIAPNASSSIICGYTSAGIEPLRANGFTHKTLSGSFFIKNKYLEREIKRLVPDKGERDRVWASIVANNGSVQHLTILPPEQKDVYKTAVEINQEWVVEHAADRQRYIDQAQSVNVFFPAEVDWKVIHKVHLNAWKKGLKTLYYLRTEKLSGAESINDDADCLGCAN